MKYAVGLMSGTSLDGIDAALVKMDNKGDKVHYQLVDFYTMPFSEEMKKKITDSLSIEQSNVELICSLNFELGQLFGEAVVEICERNDMASSELLFVASHGQTIYHQPVPKGQFVASTLQIGESSLIAEITETTVISDFRYRDMAVGGQGAPIVPYSEYLLYKSEESQRILQNIGGISNATIVPQQAELQDLLAFDTGPGNMIIDELCRHFYEQEYDASGNYAKLGQINEALLAELMAHPFIEKTGPKTTGREDFGEQFVAELLTKYDMPANDWIRTATLFTAKAIAKALAPYLTEQTELVVGGGGSYNETLLEMLRSEMPMVKVLIQEDLGLSSEAKEAIAMVVLGHQTLNKRPSNVPSATGASKAVILGKVTYY